MGNRSKKNWVFPERSRDVPGGPRARIIDFSMVFGNLEGVHLTDVSRARRGGADRSRFPKPKIKPNIPGTGTGLGCLVSGLSPVHGHGLLGVWPLTSTGAWA